MNRYEEFTVEEIEDLANECERMADENSALQGLNAELLAALIGLYDLRSHILNAAVKDNAGVLHSTTHIAAKLEYAREAIAKAKASGLTPP